MLRSPTKSLVLLVVVMVIAAALAPRIAPAYYTHLANQLMIYGILAVGLDILIGVCGQFAFAHAACFGIGCYTTALLQMRLGVPFVIGLPAGAVLAGAVGFLVGFPAMRMRALYLALATFAFAEAVRWLAASWDALTGGSDGLRISPASLFGLVIVTESDAFPVVAFIFTLAVIAAAYLVRSRLGAEMLAVRESEHVALASGIDVSRIKLLAFTISAIFAGAAGGVFALTHSFVNPDEFGFATAIVVLTMLAVGGFGSIPGVLAGVVVIGLMPEVLRGALKSIQVWQELIYGAILMATMMFMPLGLAGLTRSIIAAMRSRRPPPRVASSASRSA
jgi:branched-chain amino acid transport system permease protein